MQIMNVKNNKLYLNTKQKLIACNLKLKDQKILMIPKIDKLKNYSQLIEGLKGNLIKKLASIRILQIQKPP